MSEPSGISLRTSDLSSPRGPIHFYRPGLRITSQLVYPFRLAQSQLPFIQIPKPVVLTAPILMPLENNCGERR